jgi:hypothetical protein
MRPLAIALALAVLAPAPALAQGDPALEEARARCQEAAGRLKAAARSVDGDATLALERAKDLAQDALDQAHSAEQSVGRPRLVLPWLEVHRADVSRDATRRDVAERLHLSAERLLATCAALRLEETTGAQVDRSRLVAILSRPEYDLAARDEHLLAQLALRLWTWLRDVLVQSEAVQKGALSMRTLLLGGAALLVVVLGFRIARARLRRRAAPRVPTATSIGLDDPRHYESEAAAALQRGEAREAVRLGLLSLLATLERARLADPGRAATNREVAEELPVRGGTESLSDGMRRLVAWYDRVWYGLAPVSLDEARTFVADARALALTASSQRSPR